MSGGVPLSFGGDEVLLADLVQDFPELADAGVEAQTFAFDLSRVNGNGGLHSDVPPQSSTNMLLDTLPHSLLSAPAGMAGLFVAPPLPPMPPPPMPSGPPGMLPPTNALANPAPAAHGMAVARVTCPYCGGRATNLGGAKRAEKYTYLCDEPACQQRWNQKRNADPITGDLDITTSNRAIGNEPRRSGGYACGKCGAKPKFGHICPNKYGPANAAGLAASATAASDASALTALSMAAAAVQAASALQASPASAQAAGVSSLPVLLPAAAPTQSGVPAPLPSLPPTTMPVTSLPGDALGATAPTVAQEDDNDLFGDDDDDLFGDDDDTAHPPPPLPPPPSPPPLRAQDNLFGSDSEDDSPPKDHFGDTEDDDDAAATIITTTTKNDPPSKNSTSRKKEADKPELLAAAADDDDDMEAMSGFEAHKLLNVIRNKVKGDGSCWVYAVLACLGLLEHDHPKNTYDPTPRDRGMDALCRLFAGAWFEQHKASLNLSDTERTSISATIEVVPEYPCTVAADMGSFGNITTIMGLAVFFEIHIVCWDKTTLRNREACQQVIEFCPSSAETLKRCKEHAWTAAQIVEFSATHASNTIHIEWDGVNHYAALTAMGGQVVIDGNISSMLLNVDPVTRQKPSPLSATRAKRGAGAALSGWTMLSNKIRLDAAKCQVVKAKRTIEKHLTEAALGGFNGILKINLDGSTSVKYLRYDFNVTAQDCADVVNFTTELYLRDPNAKRRKLTAPVDLHASCFCRKCYHAGQSEIEIACTNCSRWCHVGCAFPDTEMSHAQLQQVESTWQCQLCMA